MSNPCPGAAFQGLHRRGSADDEHRRWDRCADSAFWTESIWLHLVLRARERLERGRGAPARDRSKKFITKLTLLNGFFWQLAGWFLFFFAPSKCPIDLFGPVANRTIPRRLLVAFTKSLTTGRANYSKQNGFHSLEVYNSC